MFQQLIGKSTFQNLLMRYLQKFAYDNVDIFDFSKTFNEVSVFCYFTQTNFLTVIFKNVNLLDWNNKTFNATTFLLPWVTQRGYPTVEVHRNSVDKTLTLSQSRYAMNSSVPNNKWYIPVLYLLDGHQDSKLTWLTPENNSMFKNVAQ